MGEYLFSMLSEALDGLAEAAGVELHNAVALTGTVVAVLDALPASDVSQRFEVHTVANLVGWWGGVWWGWKGGGGGGVGRWVWGGQGSKPPLSPRPQPALEGTMDLVANVWSRFAHLPNGKPARADAFSPDAAAALATPEHLAPESAAPFLACRAACEVVRVLVTAFGANEIKRHLKRQLGR